MPPPAVDNSSSLEDLLQQAKAGDRESLGKLLEAYQNYLRLLAQTQLDDQLRSRLSPSDIVQETMLEAHCDFPQFRGNSDSEFFGWLRRILANNLARAVEQHILTAKRDVRREVSRVQLDASLDHSAMRIEAILADHGSPADSHVSLQEQLVRLANALVKLTPDHRDVIVFRHFEGLPFADVAKRMNRSSGATRMLWLRGIEQLRHWMKEREH